MPLNYLTLQSQIKKYGESASLQKRDIKLEACQVPREPAM